jgi:RNA methyltransferase, TrmH family
MISSRSNTTIKSIRELRRRKERDQTQRYWIEGIRLVTAAAEVSAEIECVVFAPELLASEKGLETVALLRTRGVPVLDVSPEVFRSISSRDGPQGLGAVLGQRWLSLSEIGGNEGLCWLALDRIADPGNLGSIIRTCDATGAAGIILLGETTDPYDPAAVRGSMGAICSTRLIRAEGSEFSSWIAARSIHLVGTSDRGRTDYREAAYEPPLTILVGSEREGLPDDLLQLCTETVRIPMVGRGDSLNASVAMALTLYQAFTRRRPVEP